MRHSTVDTRESSEESMTLKLSEMQRSLEITVAGTLVARAYA